MSERRDVDWAAIREEYEGGGASLSALERAHGISRQAIKKRALREGWVTPPLPVAVTADTQGVISRDVNAAVRVAEAIKYRQAGWTYERIAHYCGYASPGSARNAVQNELDRVITQSIDEWRNDQIARLEKMHEEVWVIAMDRKARGRLFAFDRLISIADRLSKLMGMDAKSEDAMVAQVLIREVPSGYIGAVAKEDGGRSL